MEMIPWEYTMIMFICILSLCIVIFCYKLCTITTPTLSNTRIAKDDETVPRQCYNKPTDGIVYESPTIFAITHDIEDNKGIHYEEKYIEISPPSYYEVMMAEIPNYNKDNNITAIKI